MSFGRLFQFIRTPVPAKLEQCSNSTGTGVQLSWNKARAEKAHYKSISGGE